MSKELLDGYKRAVDEFLAEVNSFTPNDLLHSPITGEWPASFVIHHIADSEAYFLIRFLNALSVDRPTIVPFDEELFPTALHYKNRSAGVSLTAIKGSSGFLVDVLSHISGEAWNRVSIHPTNGELSVKALLDKVTGHYQAHTSQIREIKAAL